MLRLNGVKSAEVIGEGRRGFAGSFWRDAVDFAAIACREHQRLVKNALQPELFGRLASLISSKRHTLADLDRGRAVIQSDEHNFHGADLGSCFCSGFGKQSLIPKSTGASEKETGSPP